MILKGILLSVSGFFFLSETNLSKLEVMYHVQSLVKK